MRRRDEASRRLAEATHYPRHWCDVAVPAPGTRIDFHASSREAVLIKDWIATHQTGWKFSSTGFDPDKTQLICGTYGIELVDDMILLDYYKHKDDDPDSAIQLERVLSPDEQAFWQSLIR